MILHKKRNFHFLLLKIQLIKKLEKEESVFNNYEKKNASLTTSFPASSADARKNYKNFLLCLKLNTKRKFSRKKKKLSVFLNHFINPFVLIENHLYIPFNLLDINSPLIFENPDLLLYYPLSNKVLNLFKVFKINTNLNFNKKEIKRLYSTINKSTLPLLNSKNMHKFLNLIDVANKFAEILSNSLLITSESNKQNQNQLFTFDSETTVFNKLNYWNASKNLEHNLAEQRIIDFLKSIKRKKLYTEQKLYNFLNFEKQYYQLLSLDLLEENLFYYKDKKYTNSRQQGYKVTTQKQPYSMKKTAKIRSPIKKNAKKIVDQFKDSASLQMGKFINYVDQNKNHPSILYNYIKGSDFLTNKEIEIADEADNVEERHFDIDPQPGSAATCKAGNLINSSNQNSSYKVTAEQATWFVHDLAGSNSDFSVDSDDDDNIDESSSLSKNDFNCLTDEDLLPNVSYNIYKKNHSKMFLKNLIYCKNFLKGFFLLRTENQANQSSSHQHCIFNKIKHDLNILLENQLFLTFVPLINTPLASEMELTKNESLIVNLLSSSLFNYNASLYQYKLVCENKIKEIIKNNIDEQDKVDVKEMSSENEINTTNNENEENQQDKVDVKEMNSENEINTTSNEDEENQQDKVDVKEMSSENEINNIDQEDEDKTKYFYSIQLNRNNNIKPKSHGNSTSFHIDNYKNQTSLVTNKKYINFLCFLKNLTLEVLTKRKQNNLSICLKHFNKNLYIGTIGFFKLKTKKEEKSKKARTEKKNNLKNKLLREKKSSKNMSENEAAQQEEDEKNQILARKKYMVNKPFSLINLIKGNLYKYDSYLNLYKFINFKLHNYNQFNLAHKKSGIVTLLEIGKDFSEKKVKEKLNTEKVAATKRPTSLIENKSENKMKTTNAVNELISNKQNENLNYPWSYNYDIALDNYLLSNKNGGSETDSNTNQEETEKKEQSANKEETVNQPTELTASVEEKSSQTIADQPGMITINLKNRKKQYDLLKLHKVVKERHGGTKTSKPKTKRKRKKQARSNTKRPR